MPARPKKQESNLHGRPRKNNNPFGIYENIKLGLINYTLLSLIEHHGVFINSDHYVSLSCVLCQRDRYPSVWSLKTF